MSWIPAWLTARRGWGETSGRVCTSAVYRAERPAVQSWVGNAVGTELLGAPPVAAPANQSDGSAQLQLSVQFTVGRGEETKIPVIFVKTVEL